MTRTKAFTAQRHRIEIDGRVFILAKGASAHARWYVLDENGKYLSRRGGATRLDAEIEASRIARPITA